VFALPFGYLPFTGVPCGGMKHGPKHQVARPSYNKKQSDKKAVYFVVDPKLTTRRQLLPLIQHTTTKAKKQDR